MHLQHTRGYSARASWSTDLRDGKGLPRRRKDRRNHDTGGVVVEVVRLETVGRPRAGHKLLTELLSDLFSRFERCKVPPHHSHKCRGNRAASRTPESSYRPVQRGGHVSRRKITPPPHSYNRWYIFSLGNPNPQPITLSGECEHDIWYPRLTSDTPGHASSETD